MSKLIQPGYTFWNGETMGRIDPYDKEDSFEDEYFDGEDLNKDMLYSLYDEDEYDFEELPEEEDD